MRRGVSRGRGPVARSLAQRRALLRVGHRPWPLPEGRWLVGQSWEDLLFAHWPVDFTAVRALVPEGLELDTFDGTPWVGVVPFAMRGVRLAWCPPVPGTSPFPEVNLRTYVILEGRPGVFFFTLEAHNPAALLIGRRVYGLPYRRAAVSLRRAGAAVSCRTERACSTGPAAIFDADYEPSGPARAPVKGTLEHWLTERYCFYAQRHGDGLSRTDVHHVPWPLQPARADIRSNTLGERYGLDLSGSPLLHFSRAQDVVAWPPAVVRRIIDEP